MTPSKKSSQVIFYLLSFFLPCFIFLSYFLSNQTNILTVDLGQQYIDFLAYLKNNFFSDPLKLIYNFNQGLGSSFIGTSAYYLTSPFNWLLFFFPNNYLPQAILLIISLKIGAIGLSAYYFWQTKFQAYQKIYALAASLAYALSGYVIAFNLNLMWLDSLILLPLLTKGIDQLFIIINRKQLIYLTLITFLIWTTNFYTGYMILLFGLFYYLWQLFWQETPLKSFKSTIFSYLFAEISASLIACFLLLPTISDLFAGKVQGKTDWTLTWQFPLWKGLSKFLNGAFSFHEMSHGLPNVYLPSILLLLSLLFFFNPQIKFRPKLASFIFLGFLIISLSFTPLVLIWHLGQFPVWYPGRQSFLLIFYLLDLMMLTLARQSKLVNWQKIILIIAGIALLLYFIFTRKYFAFANSLNLTISSILIICSLLLIIFFNYKYSPLLLFALVALSSTSNLVLSLSSISYQNNSEYSNYTNEVSKASSWLQIHDYHLYRTEKNFSRSDNDPLSSNYAGVSSFNSINNHQVIRFINYLGLKNNDNSFENQYATLATDSILGIKYYLVAPHQYDNPAFNTYNYRPSLMNKRALKQYQDFNIIKNQTALPLIFASPTSSNPYLISNDPTQNQTNILNNITGKKFILYQENYWPLAQLQNAKESKSNWHEFKKINPELPSKVSFTFVPTANDPYYLELPPDLDQNSTTLRVNHQLIDNSELGSNNHLIEIANRQKDKPVKITFTLHHKELYLGNALIWQFNQTKFNQVLKSYLKKQPQIKQTSALSLSFNFKAKSRETLKSTIPYSSAWLVYDNHHLIQTKPFAHTFLSFDLKPGYHQIKLIYLPLTLLIGMLISLIALIIFIIILSKRKFVQKNNQG